MTAARQALWREAQALSDLAGCALPPRLRRLAVAADAPMSLGDVRPRPDWARPEADAEGLARLTGAVLVSRAWRREISGEVLGRACEAVGEAALDALLALPDLMTPGVEDAAAEGGDAEALDRLGLSALVAATAEGDGRRDRLARRLGRVPRAPGAPVAEARAAAAMRTAQGVMISLAGPSAAEAPA